MEHQLAHAEQIAREKAERGITVRELAHEWMEWQREVKQIKPATLVDYHALLREPGVKYASGSRVTRGRMMKALGDRPINRVTTREISDFLRSLDREGLSARNVNKHRQVLTTMFRYACREDTYNLPKNPSTRPTSAPSRRRPRPTTSRSRRLRRSLEPRLPASTARASATSSTSARTTKTPSSTASSSTRACK